MMRKLFPLILGLVGLLAGAGTGYLLRKPSSADDHASAEATLDQAADNHAEAADHTETDDHGEDAPDATGDHGEGSEGGPEYVKMNNQFVVPVVEDGRVDAMVVLAISLEVEAGNTENVYQREPKLRDAFLQVMFDHANVGGFGGTFTDGSNLIVLRTNLKEAAAMILGTAVRDVLITDIARQDS
ncbi:MAG TPA: flagellar basal body-associated FliL family protein [Tabrizicola sp.]|nr:flagellar basal body-associated FliL family protein [Tabrizicola sp.]